MIAVPIIGRRRIEVTFFHLSREKKKFADALPALASMTKIDCGVDLQPLQIEARDSPAYCFNIEEEPDVVGWIKKDVPFGGVG